VAGAARRKFFSPKYQHFMQFSMQVVNYFVNARRWSVLSGFAGEFHGAFA
jgi:hypothetical protein